MNTFEDSLIAKRHRDFILAGLSNGIVAFAFAVISFAVLPFVQAMVTTLMVMTVLYGMSVSRALSHNQDLQTRMTTLRDLRHLELIALHQPRDEEASSELLRQADHEMLQSLGQAYDLIAAVQKTGIYIALQIALLFASAWLGTVWSLPILNFLAKVEVLFH
ncbi:hypothetical protein SAMN06295998_1235 [Primorskyibacter flagellatus]|uniref:Uncharacterized protein n=1 Tax=Primorskyibacter flagellatus TaxID=1387277 RepID=A0A1W2E7M1_9RHOB|nr:hypothetical protein SAMN06295998_1235 [Primorskyibacter flagellatus]